jgi:hypothetical protein
MPQNAHAPLCERRDIDRYGRTVAVCWVGAGEPNRVMMRKGWAVAGRHFSMAYAERLGPSSLIWQALSRSRGAGGASSNAVEGQDLVVPMAGPASGAVQSASRQAGVAVAPRLPRCYPGASRAA